MSSEKNAVVDAVVGNTLTVARRAWTERQETPSKEGTKKGHRRKRRQEPPWPDTVLIFDTETTIDELQNLTFGTYRYARWTADKQLACVEEGLLYADDLSETDPAGYAT